MVSTLPIKNEKLPSSTLTPGTATLMTDEPESLPLPDSSEAPGDATTSPAKPKHLSALGHVRNHFRVRSGSAVLSHERPHAEDAKKLNRVLIVLMRRLGSSKTFGENVIFMLNRAGESSTGVGRDKTLMTSTESTPEGLCMQLLILKILYLLFTTPGTQEYFYTNDLRVLLDVFIRELVDLPEECEAVSQSFFADLDRIADIVTASSHVSPCLVPLTESHPTQNGSLQAPSDQACSEVFHFSSTHQGSWPDHDTAG